MKCVNLIDEIMPKPNMIIKINRQGSEVLDLETIYKSIVYLAYSTDSWIFTKYIFIFYLNLI